MNRLRYIAFLFLTVIFSCDSEKEKRDKEFSTLESLVSKLENEGQILGDRLDSLAHLYQDQIQNWDSLKSNADFSKYQFQGAFSTNLPNQDSSLSSVIILNTTPNWEMAMEEVAVTNFLDEMFAGFLKSNALISQVYSNSSKQVSRVYPAYDHQNIVDPNIDVREFNFFYAANEVNNPSKGIVWIKDTYVDPAGRGWILSLVHPIYRGNELFAVLGADFTVDDIINNYFDTHQGEYILANTKGDIIAGKSKAIEMLSMPPLKNHVYQETVKSEFFRVSDFNLFNSKSREVRRMAQEFLLNKKDEFYFEEEKNLNKAICRPVKGIDWILFQIIPSK
ncbi:PDC sensor domain-containing protein [Algoriphagus mannitolivorans]|uniref:PDC sensor domain-containing protein n=1 Tax=Algoriphagus mannitolivorans TaxID=226504 RepID=UPI0004211B21|nr:PDC sensor domain-containing protein [Algoriphagus mannitolivorans]